MRLNLKAARAALLLALAAGVWSGCGGINASHSVSPATFFLPGLGHRPAPAPVPAEAPLPPAVQVVQAR